jgi:hypothetical protein
LLIVAILFEATNSGATKTKIMYDVFILSVMLAAKTNIDQHCLKNCLMKMRRKELNYNKKVRIFDPRELTMNRRGFLSRCPNFVK